MCSVDVPYGSDYTALIAISTLQETDYEDNVKIVWDYGARVWVYVLIVGIPSVFLVVCVITTVIVCCYCRNKKKKSYQPLTAATTVNTRSSSATSLLTVNTSAPPPYSPGYGTMSGGTRCHALSDVASDFTESLPVTADTPKPPQPPSKEQLDSAPLHRQRDIQDSPPSYETAVAGTAALL